jgi:RHS repeat-associated protein
VQDQLDGTGQHYRRNRYYDVNTGRFTQEDPIGLAGGVNAYGFANGDPVSYSDPYGLCPIPSLCAGALGALAGAGLRVGLNALTDRPLSEGVLESAVGGFIIGASFGTAAPEATTAFFARAGGTALRTTTAATTAAAGGSATGRVMLHAGQQGKHIVGHNNYIPGRSILTHTNPQALLDRFAGTGQVVQGTLGQPGFRERVNFGQVIGTFIDQATGAAARTTNGIIHYSATGAHIVPARP